VDKLQWTSYEITAYLEYKINNDLADEYEIEMYEDMIWNIKDKVDKKKFFNTYLVLIEEMNEEYGF
jgi:hypothetical protein